MKILVVTPYPPARDGIANYAAQEVRALRREGHDVVVLSPEPSAAHLHLDLTTARGALALARRMRAYERVVVQYHPTLFGGRGDRSDALLYAVLARAFRRHGCVHLRVHEWADAALDGPGHAPRALRSMLLAVQALEVHTDTERERLARTLRVRAQTIVVVTPGRTFVRRADDDRAAARDRLGLPRGEFNFLCIGFVQHHKGFDRAVRAFDGLAGSGARLDIVGSARVPDAAVLAHVAELRWLASSTAGVHLHEAYVSDAEFDRWILASDVVVLPYRLIWSSSVAERAAMLGRPVIATAVGGLDAQARPEWSVVDDDDGLATAMRAAVGSPAPPTVDDRGSGPVAEVDRAFVMAEIAARAAALRRGNEPGSSDRSLAVRRIAPLGIPAPAAARRRSRAAKRAVRRVTAWEIDPIVGQVNELRSAMIEALEAIPDPATTDR